MAKTFPETEEEFVKQMDSFYEQNKSHISAVGECGLDYDRLFLSSKEEQLRAFPLHLDLA